MRLLQIFTIHGKKFPHKTKPFYLWILVIEINYVRASDFVFEDSMSVAITFSVGGKKSPARVFFL